MHVRGASMYFTVVALSSTSAVLAAVQNYGQCGGLNYKGDSVCVSGSSCVKVNDYYSQCTPGNAGDNATATSTLATIVVPSKPTAAAGAAGLNGEQCSLDAKFKARGKKYFGVATDKNRFSVSPNGQIIINDFGQVTPENSMKWDSTEKVQNTYTLDTANALVDYATTNKKLIRGHTLVWHSQLPTWVSSITDKTKLQQVMVAHINKLMGQYKGKIYAWDVINEMFNENGSLRSSVFYNVLGEDFVSLAFKTARAADPSAKLYINDYNLDSAGYAKTKAIVAKVKQWRAAGVPIDGIGSQAHLSNSWPIGDFPGALQSLCSVVSECAITELDIKGASVSDYQTATKACLDLKNCVGVTVWGIRDPDSWRPDITPLLFDSSSQAKAAYNGLCTLLS